MPVTYDRPTAQISRKEMNAHPPGVYKFQFADSWGLVYRTVIQRGILKSVLRRYFHIYYDAAIITQDLILNNIQYENQLWTAHCLRPSENLHRVLYHRVP